MIDNVGDERTKQLVLNAVMTYGDACSLPSLTPECPFYTLRSDGSPTCGEECRSMLERWGVESRPVRQVGVGGLVLHGRRLPLSAAAGANDFDARKKYMEDRAKPAAHQCSSSLLLGLMSRLTTPPFQASETKQSETTDKHYVARATELANRGFPVERMLEVRIIPRMARAVCGAIAVPYVRAGGLLPPYASVGALDHIERFVQGGWTGVLEAAFADEGVPGDALRAAALQPASFVPLQQSDPFELIVAQQEPGLELILDLGNANHQRLLYLFSGRFMNRVEAWLARLLRGRLSDFAQWASPSDVAFLVLPDRPTTPERQPQWLWERYTETSLEDWSESSLLLEWSVLAGKTPAPLSPLVWAERNTDQERIANQALTKGSQRSSDAPSRGRRRDLVASSYVEKAARLLRAGDVERAADIFYGLTELSPKDGDAWNNLGFCLLWTNPQSALLHLERASLLKTLDPLVNVANRALALHLLGHDGAASALARDAIEEPNKGTFAFLWAHDGQDSPARLMQNADVWTYIHELKDHISSGACSRDSSLIEK